ncbi:MAG: hypothetical protein JSS07_04545 [Proteobacteria bacterium]|nr:hypothetical protein [Pseudomonadota bacterium]
MSKPFQYIPTDLLETLQLDLPWQPHQGVQALPEAQLIYSLITQAWHDASAKTDCLDRREARRWFFSEPFERFCHLTSVCPHLIQKKVSNHWSIEHEKSRAE